MRRPTLEFVERDPGADVLVVTNMWPEPDRPVYGIFVQRQVESLRREGVRCDVLYLRGFASRGAYPAAALRFLRATFTWRGRYRLVHVHAGETALAARFLLGLPILVSYCGDDLLGDPREDGAIPLVNRARAGLVRRHANLFPATITKSQEMHDRLPARARRRNTVLPNGVDTEHFRPMDRAGARRRLGWGQDEKIVLFAGTKPNSTRKRLSLAQRACALAEERIVNLRLHVCAAVPPEDMPLLMNAADCLLVTSSLEGSPNVVKEALMCNLPVVATDCGDVRLLLQGVEPSWLCDSQPVNLAAAIVSCLMRGERSNGRERALPQLSSAAIAKRVKALYAELDTGLDPPTRREEEALRAN